MEFITNKTVSELNFLDEIDILESDYNLSHANLVTNVSDWNPSKEFKSELSNILATRYPVDSIDYIFSYTQSEQRKAEILQKLGCPTDKSILFTHSGSSSILNCINMLYAMGIKQLIILCPAYFTLFHACKIYHIKCVPIYLERGENGYCTDIKDLLNKKDKRTAFWVTNPVYCTSVYYNENMIAIFKELLIDNIVVFDESLCISSMELSRKLCNFENFVGIYSPHKSVCINGNKFSVIVTDQKVQNFFDAWSDVLCGCLSTGNDIAISHYLSDNFSKYNEAFSEKILLNKGMIEKLCDNTNISYDQASNGYLITVFFPNIDAKKGLDLSFIKTIMNETGIRFISGKRNHFGDNMGFCFRINLAEYNNNNFHYAIERAFRFLSQYN